jgi:hypothetical protein
MGSYDTGETYTPTRRSTERTSERETSRPTEQASTPQASYEAGAPILISLGGGLTPSRIVKKLPEEYEAKTLLEVVKYMINPDNLVTTEENAIADAVRDRMRMDNYRAIINNRYNFHNERLRTDVLQTYLNKDTRETEGGTVVFNRADMAIVSHDEGGKNYITLDRLVR